MPPAGTRKRKSKTADNPQKKKEQPVAKKPKIQAKQEHTDELKSEAKVAPVSRRGKGRGRPKKETNTSKTSNSEVTNNVKLSPNKGENLENISDKKKVGKKLANTKSATKKVSPKKTANKKITKKTKAAQQNGTDENTDTTPKVEITDEKSTNDTSGKPVNKKSPNKTKKSAASPQTTMRKTCGGSDVNTEKKKGIKPALSATKREPATLAKPSGRGRGRPKKASAASKSIKKA